MAAKGRLEGPSTLERGDVAERQGGRLMLTAEKVFQVQVHEAINHPIR